MKISFRHTLNILGSALGIAGIVFVGIKLNIYADQLDFSRFHSNDWVIIALCTLIYASANMLLGLAWYAILKFLGVGNVGRVWATKVYGLSQLAKYVPGNIFHLAGRQAYGMAAGIAAMPLAKSSALELGLIATSGGMFAVLLAPFVFPSVTPVVSAFLFIIATVVLSLLLRYFVSYSLAWALLWQTVFLVISGCIFVWILTVVSHDQLESLSLPFLCGAYVIAWLVGLVTPGAPAGIGIREAVLLFLLGNTLPHADLLLAVLLGRIVTVLGDIIYFGISSCIKNHAVNEPG
jgi:hypothetical protein